MSSGTTVGSDQRGENKKIKILLFFIIAIVSDLTTLETNTPHKGRIKWQTQVYLSVVQIKGDNERGSF